MGGCWKETGKVPENKQTNERLGHIKKKQGREGVGTSGLDSYREKGGGGGCLSGKSKNHGNDPGEKGSDICTGVRGGEKTKVRPGGRRDYWISKKRGWVRGEKRRLNRRGTQKQRTD